MAIAEWFSTDLLSLNSLSIFLQIVLIDLVLAGDNAIIVGMVAARVPAHIRKKVILFGVGAAVVMRIGFSLIAVQMLSVVGLKLVGGALLLWVCWRLWFEIRSGYDEQTEKAEHTAEDADAGSQLSAIRPAVIQIVIADLSMSIDNVLAIAGISRDKPVLLIFGLALSVAFMIFAATVIAKLLKRYPWIAYIGIVLILYVAVVMIWEGARDVTNTLG
ncbi:MAG: TerC family protein [Granulosicoccus sp.]